MEDNFQKTTEQSLALLRGAIDDLRYQRKQSWNLLTILSISLRIEMLLKIKQIIYRAQLLHYEEKINA